MSFLVQSLTKREIKILKLRFKFKNTKIERLKNTRGGALVSDQNFYGGAGLVDGVGKVTVKEA